MTSRTSGLSELKKVTPEDRRCDFRWTNRYGDKLRCMLDRGHSNVMDKTFQSTHVHGIQFSRSKEGE